MAGLVRSIDEHTTVLVEVRLPLECKAVEVAPVVIDDHLRWLLPTTEEKFVHSARALRELHEVEPAQIAMFETVHHHESGS